LAPAENPDFSPEIQWFYPEEPSAPHLPSPFLNFYGMDFYQMDFEVLIIQGCREQQRVGGSPCHLERY